MTFPSAREAADEEGMRRRSVVTALVAVTAGLTVAALRRRAARLRTQAAAVSVPSRPVAMSIPTAVPATVASAAPVAPVVPAASAGAVVMPFTPRIVTASAGSRQTEPARCGDTGGRTKAGAPCAGRATSGGRCHHHRIAV